MTEYKTFDDYVKNTFSIEPRELTHLSPEEQKKKTVAITVDELINIWNEITELKVQTEKMKCCGNCEWKAKGVCNGNDVCGLKEWKLVETRR